MTPEKLFQVASGAVASDSGRRRRKPRRGEWNPAVMIVALAALAGVPERAVTAAAAPPPQVVTPDPFSWPPRTALDERVRFAPPRWTEAGEGLELARIRVYRLQGDEHLDTVVVLRVDPALHTLRIVHSNGKVFQSLEEWRRTTAGCVAASNAGMFLAEPHGVPLGPMRRDGERLGPRRIAARHRNDGDVGMVLAGPLAPGLPEVAVRDLKHEPEWFEEASMARYRHAVQSPHVLLDRDGEVRMRATARQASRNVTAIGGDGALYLLFTEGGFFTLHNLGRFLRDARNTGALDIRTAVNMDGGAAGGLVVHTPWLRYRGTTSLLESQGIGKVLPWPAEARLPVPGALCVVPRSGR
jgi:hypothetical protein